MRRPYLFILLASCFTLVIGAGATNVLVDPFRFYHAPWFDIGFSDNQRFQNPGLARTMDYENVLIGTSHTEPFITSELDEALGGKSLNLSISGSLISEQALMLEQVLRQGKVKRVLWEINYPSFSFGSGVSDPATFPWFLFRPTAETPFRYLVSWDTFQESLSALGGERAASLDQLHRWDLEASFGADRVLANWDFMTRRWNDELRAFWAIYAVNPEDLARVVSEEIEGLVRQHPGVRFDLLLVPSTLYDYANDLQVAPDRLDKRLLLRHETARLARTWPNAHAWDFQGDSWLVNDLSHYKDMDHFGQGVIRELLNRLAVPEAASSPEQVEQETGRLRRRVIDFLDEFCAEQPARCQPALREQLEVFRGN
jgi:hypothetical protein